MDFGLREWLLILGPVFIIIVLVHGYLRMRANRNTLKMSLDRNFLDSHPEEGEHHGEDISMLRAELPNGGARVRRIPEQGSLNLDEDVPMLMEPVEMGRKDHRPRRDESKADAVAAAKPEKQVQEKHVQEEHVHEEHVMEAPQAEPEKHTEQQSEPIEKPEHFVVLYVSADSEPFEGQALLESLIGLGMRFGEMDIFHYIGADGTSSFSLVNAVEPGTFDMAAMAGQHTPAVSLFMRAHELDEPLAVFDQMVEVAQALADELGGDVKDSSRSVLTPQTIEYSREEIRAYQHKYC